MWVQCINSNCLHDWDYKGKAEMVKCPKCKKNIKRQELKRIKDPYEESTIKKEDDKKQEFGLLTGIDGAMGTSDDDDEDDDSPWFEVVDKQIEEIDEEGDEDQEILTKEEWLDLVGTLDNSEYGELYQMLNDGLNEWLKTTRFDMTQKRTTIMGKLTRKVLLLHKPTMKPWQLLAGILALSYGKAGFELGKEKHELQKAKAEAEKQVTTKRITTDQVETDQWVRGDTRQTTTKKQRKRKKPEPTPETKARKGVRPYSKKKKPKTKKGRPPYKSTGRNARKKKKK